MDFKTIFPLALAVLKDWRVIFIAIFSIAFMMTGSYVVKYRKRPPRPKKVKAAAPKPAEAAPADGQKKEEKKEEPKEEEKK